LMVHTNKINPATTPTATSAASMTNGHPVVVIQADGQQSTGKYAGLVVPELVRHGLQVRAMVHDPDKAEIARSNGASEVVEADLGDRASLDSALRDVDGVFLITPAFHPQATQLGLNMVYAAADAGVGKIVYNGVYHPSLSLVNHQSTRPIEEALYISQLDFTVLQPAMYMQGLEGACRQALQTGALVMPWSKHSKMTYVDYRDVAEVVAIAFSGHQLSYGTFELAAGGMFDHIDLADLIGSATGRRVTAEAPQASGQPQGRPDGLEAMFAEYDTHGFHGGNALVLRAILRRHPRSITDYLNALTAAHRGTDRRR
ncbi:NmrA family NAD(P)-binding protein, partial [Mycobacterium sherrisii]|uniref:NmrA family NAD(P)-binding protein n=1 Tax=Mycobacterium sherrisii TaxID=243061 RepID=UPI00397499DA